MHCSVQIKIVTLLQCRYDLVQELCESNEGWKEINSIDDDFDLFWCDTARALHIERAFFRRSFSLTQHIKYATSKIHDAWNLNLSLQRHHRLDWNVTRAPRVWQTLKPYDVSR